MTLATLTRAEIAARLSGKPGDRAAFMREAAEVGMADAQALYGQLLLDGDGVVRDAAGAFAWFNRAAAQGHAMALNMVGRCYDLGWGVAIEKVRAAECFRVAAAGGLPESMYNYATALTLGAGVSEDKAAALAWYERAAGAGYAKAANFVGSFAEDGWAGPVDLAKAARCYAEAAAGGDFRGAFNHARMLLKGGDRTSALEWITRAAELGHDRFRAQMRNWLSRTSLGAEGMTALERGIARC